MTVWRRISALAFLLGWLAPPALALEVTVNSTPVTAYKGKAPGEAVDGLIWRGGIVMTSPMAEFGGLSGIAFTGPGHKVAFVSDVGNFVSGHLIYNEDGAPLGLGGVVLTAIQNSKGVDLPRQFARDAEAIETVYRDGVPAAARVGFENLTRVADFALENGAPGGPAREVNIPAWIEKLRTNASLESVCIAPPASPVAGSTLLITESARTGEGFAAYMLGNRDKGEFTVTRTAGLNPTDCAFLPNGDLLVLERGIGILGFAMQLRRIPADEVRPGVMLEGDIVLTGAGGDIDNMEGVAVHEGPDGKPRITIVSDDNFNSWERSLLLEFSLPD